MIIVSQEQEMEKPEKSMARFVLELVEVVVIAFALSWLIRTFVIEARIIPTGSMLPTIQLQDRVIVDKIFFKNFGELHTGDIIVFHPPASAHSSDDFIKRLIATPGDTVQIKNHKTYVNEQELDEPYLNKDKPQEDFGPIVVPEGSLFVMGDNRNNSADSREWGFLPEQNVTGRTLFRYWPLNHFGPLDR